MGVRSLLTYLKKHPERRCRSQSLFTIASEIKRETGNTPKLHCDFLNIYFWLFKEFHEAKIKCNDYQPYSNIYGGNFIEYQERFMDFVKVLKYIGVDPIFFVDGNRGSDMKGFEAKFKTYKSRHEKMMKNCVHLINPNHPVGQGKSWIPPPLLILHILMSMKSEGVVLKHFAGEADMQMAREAPDVCGILTNDTDLVIMRGCEIFLCAFFDREAKLGIREPGRWNVESVNDIIYESVTQSGIANLFNIEESDLKNLSIICGNDYTSGLNYEYKLHRKLKFDWHIPKIENAANWLRSTPHSPLHETSPIKEICEETSGEYKRAIDHTYLACDDESASTTDSHEGDSELFDMVLSEVKEGRMTRTLLPMAANSIHWCEPVVEDFEAEKSISDLLLPIRHLIYKLLGLKEVKEYGGVKVKEIRVTVLHPNSELLPLEVLAASIS